MKCRHCGADLRLTMLDLGTAPPSNAYLTPDRLTAPELWFPLRLRVCEACWLVQTEDFVERDKLFAADYAYFSSYSTSWLQHAQRLVAQMRQRFGLDAHHQVVEVAANDGYLLQYVRQASIPCYGIEPTASTAQAARAKGIEIIEAFFGRSLAQQLAAAGRQADWIVANNVLAHVPDINDFVAGFAILLKPKGVATFEFPHLMRLVQGNQFDTVYHEHYSYLSLITVERIFASQGLMVFDVEELPTHGGSLRVYACRRDFAPFTPTSAVTALREAEVQAGLTTPDFYRHLQPRAEQIKDALLCYLIDAKRQGLKVAGYGAAAKGNTLLNFAGVRRDLLPYVADKNPSKQGKYLPGSRIPIVAPEHLFIDRPDRILILPWNLREEVIDELHEARGWGARFVTAVPGLEVT